jgi:hypothetical protein
MTGCDRDPAQDQRCKNEEEMRDRTFLHNASRSTKRPR